MSWKVPYIDYPAQYRKIRERLLKAVDQTLLAGDVMLRGQLRDFEWRFASFVGASYGVGLGNCTDALFLALRALGIGPGDEVVTVSHTMVATVAAIHHNGATPVLVDIGEDHNMDPSALEEAITPRTRAVIPVHLNGRMCDMGRIMEVARRHNLVVVEDAAQAVGASYGGKRAGSFGSAGCFSFYPAKLLGTYGDAGILVTSDPALAERVRLLRNHGRTPDGDVAFWSFNSRMDNLHAVILGLKLDLVPGWIARRREIARLYHQMLADLPTLRLPPPPVEEGPYFDVFQNYEIEAEDRDRLVAFLREQGVETMLPWGGRAVHQFPALGLGHFRERLPRTEALFRRVLMLPMHCELSDAQVEQVAGAIRRFYGGGGA